MIQSYGAAISAHWHPIMTVVKFVAIRLFVASVVDRVGNRTLDGLRKDLLDLLGNDGGITTVLGVCLGGRLVGLAAGRVDLALVLVFLLTVRRKIEHTLSGRASSRPEGAAS